MKTDKFLYKLIAVNSGQTGIINVMLKIRLSRMNHNYLLYMLPIATQGTLKSKEIAFIVSLKLSHKSRQENIKICSKTAKKHFL